jgi:hypothetical protein
VLQNKVKQSYNTINIVIRTQMGMHNRSEKVAAYGMLGVISPPLTVTLIVMTVKQNTSFDESTSDTSMREPEIVGSDSDSSVDIQALQ